MYLGIVLLPIVIGLILVPPAVEQGVKLANELPGYARDPNEAFDENPTLREANEKYDITTKLENVAENLVSRLGDAAGALVDLGAALVSSLFALVTILVISMFMIGRGQAWRDAALRYRPPQQAERMRKATDEIARAVGSYIGGTLAQVSVAGVAAWIMLVILSVPSPLPLALIIALLDLIPLVGATLGAVVVGVGPQVRPSAWRAESRERRGVTMNFAQMRRVSGFLRRPAAPADAELLKRVGRAPSSSATWTNPIRTRPTRSCGATLRC